MILLGQEQEMNIVTKELITTNRSMTPKEVLEEAEYKVKYENSIIIIFAYGDNPPDRGGYTLNNFELFHNGAKINTAKDEYKIGRQTPNSFIDNHGVEELNRNFVITNGILSNHSETDSCVGGSGTVVKIAEIPINIQNLEIDETLFIG